MGFVLFTITNTGGLEKLKVDQVYVYYSTDIQDLKSAKRVLDVEIPLGVEYDKFRYVPAAFECSPDSENPYTANEVENLLAGTRLDIERISKFKSAPHTVCTG